MANRKCPTCGCSKRHNPNAKTIPAPERFWAKVDKRGPGECWLWQGYIDAGGHGRFAGPDNIVLAHRYSYFLHNGWLPPSADGGMVCHTCDVKACVNPAHLYAGDQSTNMRDVVERGRQKRGEQNHAAKLTTAAVIDIRRRVAEGETRKALADEYGVTATMVGYIVNRHKWRHVP